MRGQKYFSCFLPYLIFVIVVGSSRGSGGQNGCSTSCGPQSIQRPFRLKGDPAFCGDQDFELTCTGNMTIMDWHHVEYYVTEILYDEHTIRIVDGNLASGLCRLPFRFPSVGRISFEINGNYMMSWSWASFVKCSKEIRDDKYRHVPCLSGNNTFVYVTDHYLVEDLLPSCSFLSMVPTDVMDHASSGDDIFQFLKKGFPLMWNVRSFKDCLRGASRFTIDSLRTMSIFKWFLYPILLWFNFIGCVSGVLYLVCTVFTYTAIILLVISTFVRFIVAPLSIFVFLAYECWKMMIPVDIIEKFLQNQQTLTPTRYAYTDIIALTSHFKEKLGQGGFGSVFKGQLPGGHFVAVKMLSDSRYNGEDFINEVSTIGRIHHLNVVRLVGFCSEGPKRALVYEFMPGGSLDKYIFSSNGTHKHFTMEKLNEIALGVARGIDYLHRGCDMRILHFDIKPHNILLDQNFNPKVSDFGLAKLYPRDYSLVSMSAARGTIGYIAPELVSRCFGVISHKSDVYSFGMLLMEMAGGRRNVDQRVNNSSQVYYPSWIYDRLLQSEVPEMCNSIEIDDMERKLCKVGLWCIQTRPSDRPSMSRVIEMLEADVQALQMPPKPFLSTSVPVSIKESCMHSSSSELSIISEDE